jgi:hypothetical protein
VRPARAKRACGRAKNLRARRKRPARSQFPARAKKWTAKHIRVSIIQTVLNILNSFVIFDGTKNHLIISRNANDLSRVERDFPSAVIKKEKIATVVYESCGRSPQKDAVSIILISL